MAKKLTDYTSQRLCYVIAKMSSHPTLGAKCWIFWNPKLNNWQDTIEFDHLFDIEKAAIEASKDLKDAEVYSVVLKIESL